MSESTASLTRAHIETALRRYLQYGLTAVLETDQETHLDQMVLYGENMFYKGTVLPGETTVHRWSFLEPQGSISVSADDYTYNLPDDFGGFKSAGLSLDPSDDAVEDVRLTSIDFINRQRALDVTISVETPTHAAYRLKDRAQTTGQRFELILWPTPSTDCTLYFRYYSTPTATTDGAPYPLGGQPHGMTLLEACLAAAELHMNDESNGPHFQEFMRLMQSSVAFDRAQTTPQYFGKNLDRSQSTWRGRRHLAQSVEYDP